MSQKPVKSVKKSKSNDWIDKHTKKFVILMLCLYFIIVLALIVTYTRTHIIIDLFTHRTRVNRTRVTVNEDLAMSKSEAFIKTSYWYKHAKISQPLRLLDLKKINKGYELLYYYEITYGTLNTKQYAIIRIADGEIDKAMLFKSHIPINEAITHFHSENAFAAMKNQSYYPVNMFICGGVAGIRCPEGYSCVLKSVLIPDYGGLCRKK